MAWRQTLHEEGRCPNADARASHRLDECQPAPGNSRALPGGKPHVACIALLGEPHAALVAGDLERAFRLEAHELALRELEAEPFAVELHRAYWPNAVPKRAAARARATQAMPTTARVAGKRRREFM